jgi:hypothetical protein
MFRYRKAIFAATDSISALPISFAGIFDNKSSVISVTEYFSFV